MVTSSGRQMGRRRGTGAGLPRGPSLAARGLIVIAALVTLGAGDISDGATVRWARGPALPPGAGIRVAVLPLENLSDFTAPVAQIRDSLRGRLEARGIPVLEKGALEKFLREHRVRYMGGMTGEMGRALLTETGATAVLVTSLDLYAAMDPPKIALTSRLISTGEKTHILWMDGAGRTGDEAPGFLGLGRIGDPEVLRENVTGRIADSLARHLFGAATRLQEAAGSRVPRRFRPRSYYRSLWLPPVRTAPVRIAVLPFSNGSTTNRAGDVLTLQIVRHLVNSRGVEVVEPGVMREALLRSRLIQEEGLSLPQVDLLRALLDVDIAFFGELTEYLDTAGTGMQPEVEFSARAIDTASRQVIWSSSSHARGNDGVFFFGLGGVTTAHDLASEMAGALIRTFLPTVEAAS